MAGSLIKKPHGVALCSNAHEQHPAQRVVVTPRLSWAWAPGWPCQSLPSACSSWSSRNCSMGWHQGWRQGFPQSHEWGCREGREWGGAWDCRCLWFLRKELRTGDPSPNPNEKCCHSNCPCYAWLMLVQKFWENYFIGSCDNAVSCQTKHIYLTSIS